MRLKYSILLAAAFSLFNFSAQALVHLDRAEEILNVETAWDGPNCWASSLYILGLRDHWSYTGPREFVGVRDSSCSPISEQEVAVGDLVVLQALVRTSSGDKWEEYHAYLHMGPDLALSKPNYMATRVLKWVTISDAQLLNDPIRPKEMRTLYFRCGTENNFRSIFPADALAVADGLIADLSVEVMNPHFVLDQEKQTRWLNRIVSLYQWTGAHPAFMALVESIAYQWTALQYRARNGKAVPEF